MGNPRQIPLSKDYVPPPDKPTVTAINERTMAALNRLSVRGVMPQANPLVTAWQVRALMELLVQAGLVQEDDFAYHTAYFQMVDLERLVEERAPAGLVVPTSQATPFGKPNGH